MNTSTPDPTMTAQPAALTFADVAHELRTRLDSILVAAGSIKREGVSELLADVCAAREQLSAVQKSLLETLAILECRDREAAEAARLARKMNEDLRAELARMTGGEPK